MAQWSKGMIPATGGHGFKFWLSPDLFALCPGKDLSKAMYYDKKFGMSLFMFNLFAM